MCRREVYAYMRRHNSAWLRVVEEHVLPRLIQAVTGQTTVPFGDVAVALRDSVIATETCEELFAPYSPHTYLGLNGVEIIANGSGSHHELRKLHRRIDLIRNATAKGGGITGQAEAVRLGIATALQGLAPELRPAMKQAGFLKRDPRSRERKKPGQAGARKKFAWVKR